MVYESDFYTTRRPYSRPTMSSYTVTRLSDDWDTPYSWPVRREFSRILHRPRPHLGIVYTERFLNSRPLTYFDDETKVIRAQAGALLKQINMPALKPSPIRLPYSLDSYSIQRHVPYGVPHQIYSQSFYREPAHLTIGRGHLACVQYGGGKSYPRRKTLYSDENRNIRDEIKFRSYYNRPKHDDPNTLPTGFAWRLLHLPAKDAKPFKLYKHSQTLPHLDTLESKTDKENISSERNKTKTIKRYKKHATEPIEDEPSFEDENKYISYKDRPELKDEYLPRKKKIENQSESNRESMITVTNKIKPADVLKESDQKLQEDIPPKSLDTIVSNEEVVVSEKKKKKKKEEPAEETKEKPSLSRTKSLLAQQEDLPESVIPSEDLTPHEIITPPAVEKDEPSVDEPQEIIEVEIIGDIKSSVEPPEEPEEKYTAEEPKSKEPQPEVPETEYEQIMDKVIEEPQEEPEKIIEENKTPDLNTESNVIETEGYETEPVNEEKNIEQTLEKQEVHEEEIKEDILQNETVPENCAAVEDTIVEDSIIGDTDSDNAIIEEIHGGDSINQIQEVLDDSTLIGNAIEESDTEQVENESNTIVDITETETTSKYINKSENEGISEVEVHEETFRVDTQVHDGISEISYTETNTTVYTREEAITQEVDAEDSTEPATCEEIEFSQDNLNSADHITDEANVDIQEQ